MAPCLSNQPVLPGSLLLIHGPGKEPEMLLVKSTPDNNNVNASIVQTVNWHIPDQKGFWGMSGPKVRYIQQNEADHKYCICDNHSDSSNYPETTLGDYLSALDRTTNAENRENSDISIIVNPHGRDVLQHYFKGIFPQCNSKGYSYKMSSGFFNQYPELFCSCSDAEDLQVCPFCMGYRFAFQDKLDARGMVYLEELVEKHHRAMDKNKNPTARFFSCEVYDELYEELIARDKERARNIYMRKRKLGFVLEEHEQAFLTRIAGSQD